MNAGTYMIAKRSLQAGFGPPDGVKADVYREANDYCDKKGKDVETVDLQVTNSNFARPGNVSLEFRCTPRELILEIQRVRPAREEERQTEHVEERQKKDLDLEVEGRQGP